jgi:hypothetical protein
MTPTGRLAIGIALIVAGVVLCVTSNATAGVGLLTLVGGYVFGDRNGEKRLAKAIVEQQSTQPAIDAVVPPDHPVPPVERPSSE